MKQGLSIEEVDRRVAEPVEERREERIEKRRDAAAKRTPKGDR